MRVGAARGGLFWGLRGVGLLQGFRGVGLLGVALLGGGSCGGEATTAPVRALPPRGTVAYRCDAGRLVGGLEQSCRRVGVEGVAATGTAGAEEKRAVSDGDLCSGWSAGAPAPQTVTLDFGAAEEVTHLLLVPEMSSNGVVEHRISTSDDGEHFVDIATVSESMTSGTEYLITLPRDATRFLRVRTEKSPSWVAWREIVPLACGT